ncbi:MAG TPA: hypothetical protein VNO50_03165 [Pyrinomonadaceae bacterium]|nr:hypothetical protein [Pyrinomonadaceae bacterium]
MYRSRYWPCALLMVSIALCTTPLLMADTVKQLNLAEMVQRADKIYRATVVSSQEGTIQAGGGQLPVVTYRLQVEETFRGDIPAVKGVRIAEIRMLGKMKSARQGNLQLMSALPKMPQLTIGQTYLVFETRPSRIGLSTTVGLGQGSFRILQRGKEELAVNEVNNRGLFRDMDTSTRRSSAASSTPSSGPIAYQELARQIRAQLGN